MDVKNQSPVSLDTAKAVVTNGLFSVLIQPPLNEEVPASTSAVGKTTLLLGTLPASSENHFTFGLISNRQLNSDITVELVAPGIDIFSNTLSISMTNGTVTEPTPSASAAPTGIAEPKVSPPIPVR
jgi:hypothetical protein